VHQHPLVLHHADQRPLIAPEEDDLSEVSGILKKF
jgi:hypothetical protein